MRDWWGIDDDDDGGGGGNCHGGHEGAKIAWNIIFQSPLQADEEERRKRMKRMDRFSKWLVSRAERKWGGGQQWKFGKEGSLRLFFFFGLAVPDESTGQPQLLLPTRRATPATAMRVMAMLRHGLVWRERPQPEWCSWSLRCFLHLNKMWRSSSFSTEQIGKMKMKLLFFWRCGTFSSLAEQAGDVWAEPYWTPQKGRLAWLAAGMVIITCWERFRWSTLKGCRSPVMI